MKKIFLLMMMVVSSMTTVMAQESADKKQAEIKFDKYIHNFGESNVGNAPLVINQAVASCGCTVPEYTKQPVMPGQKGEIKVTYNGAGKFPGHFKKSITVRTNGKVEMTRLYVEGDMKEKAAQ